MIDENQARARAFQIWDGIGRKPGLFDECLRQAREEQESADFRNSLSGDATAPAESQTRPGQLFRNPEDDRASIDRRGRSIEADTEQPLMRTETQGVPKD